MGIEHGTFQLPGQYSSRLALLPHPPPPPPPHTHTHAHAHTHTKASPSAAALDMFQVLKVSAEVNPPGTRLYFVTSGGVDTHLDFHPLCIISESYNWVVMLQLRGMLFRSS